MLNSSCFLWTGKYLLMLMYVSHVESAKLTIYPFNLDYHVHTRLVSLQAIITSHVSLSLHPVILHFTHPCSTSLETLDRISNVGSLGLSKACWVFGDEKFHYMSLEFRASIDAHGISHCSVSVKCNGPFINPDISQAAHKW